MFEYFIQKDGKVRRMSEQQLRDELRRNKLTGMELVRRADAPNWIALHELPMYVEEVPLRGSPHDHARFRIARGFGIHLLSYLAVNIMLGFPAPVVLFWGIGLVLHGARAVPPVLELWREGKLPFLPPPKDFPAIGSSTPEPPRPIASRSRTAPHLPVSTEPSSRALAGAAGPQGRAVTAPQAALPARAIDPHAAADPHAPTGVIDPSALDPTVASVGAQRSVEDRQLRAAVRGKLFGDDHAAPVQIGRYVLDTRLGSGGMGVVFRAHDASLDRAVAVKLLRSDHDLEDATERLLREARAMARLSHPNVVTVFDVGTYESGVFVAMEFVDGLTLRQWLSDPRSVGDVLAMLRQAGEGLAAAHRAGIVHRDFKPENVMVGHDARVRVLDFGLAKPVDTQATTDHLTRTGTVLGTPRYMAPEQFRGEPADAKSDQFAFGVVLYEALFGLHPYEPQDDRPLPRTVLAGTLRPVPVRADLPPSVRDAIMRAVAHDPDARHDSIDAMLAAFGPIPTSNDELAAIAVAVRRLLARRGGDAAQQMLHALDSIERVVADLDARAAIIAAQTPPDQTAALTRELDEARRKLTTLDGDDTRALQHRRIEALEQRLAGIARALEVLDGLRARRRVAETQLAQLHLDLTRAEASQVDLPDLTGPLQELRFEVEAAQEVEALLGRA